jgi:hypothetical protein
MWNVIELKGEKRAPYHRARAGVHRDPLSGCAQAGARYCTGAQKQRRCRPLATLPSAICADQQAAKAEASLTPG